VKGRRREVDAARQRLVDHARESILADVDSADPFYEAFNRLAIHADAFLDAPAGNAGRRAPRATRARTATLVVTLVAMSATIGAAGVVVATKTDLLTLTGITAPKPPTQPSPRLSPFVITPPTLGPRDLPTRTEDPAVTQAAATAVAAYQAEQQRLADEAATAAAAAAAAAQTQQGTAGGTSTGGKTGGTTGGGTVAPPPPAAAHVSSISFHATTGTGVISITANIQTSGSMSVGVTCTANGSGIGLSGPGTVNGAASYSGSFTGLAAGNYTVGCSAGGVTSSTTTLEVY
jgi:hypothetical protein